VEESGIRKRMTAPVQQAAQVDPPPLLLLLLLVVVVGLSIPPTPETNILDPSWGGLNKRKIMKKYLKMKRNEAKIEQDGKKSKTMSDKKNA
jgi:hypothetical protein